MLQLLPPMSLLAAFGFLSVMYLFRNAIASKMRRTVRVPVPVLTNEGERLLRAQAESQE